MLHLTDTDTAHTYRYGYTPAVYLASLTLALAWLHHLPNSIHSVHSNELTFRVQFRLPLID